MSDNDLIRRGDALAVVRPTGERPCDCRGCRGSLPTAEDWARWDAFSRAAAAIDALPAVTVGVKPLRYFFAQGETVDQVREHAQAHPLAKEGDMKLVWVNEGDLYDHSIFLAAQEPVAAPVALEAKMAALPQERQDRINAEADRLAALDDLARLGQEFDAETEAGGSIIQGLREALEYTKGMLVDAVKHDPAPEVATAIREAVRALRRHIVSMPHGDQEAVLLSDALRVIEEGRG